MEGDQERLIGWQGETYKHTPPDGKGPNAEDPLRQWVETISWQPRAFVYHNFLSAAECAHLIKVASARLERSMVVGEKGDVTDPIRTSYSASLTFNEDKIITEIEHRIARWTHLPPHNGEAIEVLRYNNGQKYGAHWDWFDEKDLAMNNRVATVLMYLSPVLPDAGGETALPLAEAIDADRQTTAGMSECANVQGISVKPEPGAALLFWDMAPGGGQTDRRALHASCPTFNGTKWTATKWIHVKKY